MFFHQLKKQCLIHEHNRIYNKHQFMYRMTAVSAYAFSCLMNKLFIHVTLSWVWWRWSKRFYFTWAIDKMYICKLHAPSIRSLHAYAHRNEPNYVLFHCMYVCIFTGIFSINKNKINYSICTHYIVFGWNEMQHMFVHTTNTFINFKYSTNALAQHTDKRVCIHAITHIHGNCVHSSSLKITLKLMWMF